MASPRRLLARLRTLRASGAAPLTDLVRLVGGRAGQRGVLDLCPEAGRRPRTRRHRGAQPERGRPHQAARRRRHRRSVRRHRRGDEPAGCAEPPRLRLPPGDRRGPLRLDAGGAGAPRRPHAGGAGGAEPRAAPLHRRRSGRAGNGSDAAGRDAAGQRRHRRRGRGRRRHRAARVRRHAAHQRHRDRSRRSARPAARSDAPDRREPRAQS